MPCVFEKRDVERMYVKLSEGRMMPLEDLIRDYERFLKEQSTTELLVGRWFRIDRDVIRKCRKKIRLLCLEHGCKGEELWKRFENSNTIADEYPEQYPRLIETYIFKHNWEYKTEQEMRDMCDEIGDGMCDEVICDLELQMRICNGESVYTLLKKADTLPCARLIKLRNGGTGRLGGSANDEDDEYPPTDLGTYEFEPDEEEYNNVPYAFRLVYSQKEQSLEILQSKEI